MRATTTPLAARGVTHLRPSELYHGLLDRLCGSAVLLAAAAALTGCAVMHQNFDTRVPEHGQFTDGGTHYRDVLRELGPPAKLSKLDDGLVFLYEQRKLTERQMGIDIDYQDIPILKIVLGHGIVDGQAALLTFDADGILVSHDWEDWHRDLGWGTSVQLFLSVMSVTDSGGFDKQPTANQWGMDLLNTRLPEALNRQNSLDTGQSGLERVGTPTGAGQHTLELQNLLSK